MHLSGQSSDSGVHTGFIVWTAMSIERYRQRQRERERERAIEATVCRVV